MAPQILLLPPISCELSDIQLVQEVADASLAPALYLKDAASVALELIAAAEVKLHILLLLTWNTHWI